MFRKTVFAAISVLLLSGVSAFAQTVSGHLTEADDVPVIGAGVFVKGTTRGTVTDHNGYYTIDAVQGEVLVFSCIGFLEKEIPVGQSRVMDARMEPESQLLEELVVVGCVRSLI